MSEQRYEVTHVPHYIGQRWVEPGEVVTLPEGVKPGRWLKPVVEAAKAATSSATVSGFTIDHISRGDYVVLGADGERASIIFKNTGTQGEAKQLAEAEAARLNAGGEVNLGGSDAATSSAQGDSSAGTQQAGDLPDA